MQNVSDHDDPAMGAGIDDHDDPAMGAGIFHDKLSFYYYILCRCRLVDDAHEERKDAQMKMTFYWERAN